MAPTVGLVVVDVPVGSNPFVTEYMRRLPEELGMPTVARHVAAMEDAQTAALVPIMSLVRRAGHLERNIYPRLWADA